MHNRKSLWMLLFAFCFVIAVEQISRGNVSECCVWEITLLTPSTSGCDNNEHKTLKITHFSTALPLIIKNKKTLQKLNLLLNN